MAKKGDRRQRLAAVLEPDAAGGDIEAEEIFVAVPPERDAEPVRRFSTFTCELNALADWLAACRIRTVAMESTGGQWIQYLHWVGLLRASFRPPDEICAVRTLWRHRGSLLEMAAEHILHMQKALSQMNVHRTTLRRVLLQRQMSSRTVIIISRFYFFLVR